MSDTVGISEYIKRDVWALVRAKAIRERKRNDEVLDEILRRFFKEQLEVAQAL